MKQLEVVSATRAGLMQKLLDRELKTTENIALLTDAQTNIAKTATEISTACNQNQQQIAVLLQAIQKATNQEEPKTTKRAATGSTGPTTPTRIHVAKKTSTVRFEGDPTNTGMDTTTGLGNGKESGASSQSKDVNAAYENS